MAAAPCPNPAHEYPYDAEFPGALDLDASAAPVETPPPTQHEAPAPPTDASSSGRAALGGGREEEGLRRRLHDLAGICREKPELTEEEARANDRRQEDEVMRWSLPLPLSSSVAIGELFSPTLWRPSMDQARRCTHC